MVAAPARLASFNNKLSGGFLLFVRTVLAAASALTLVCAGGVAQAATVTIHSTIDLTQWNLTSGIGAIGTYPDAKSYTNGDTIVLDLDFLGSQTLKFTSISGIGGAALTNMADCPTSTASLAFHNFSGSGGGSVSGGQYQGCTLQIGANFPSSSPGFPSGPIEFSGVTFTFASIGLHDNATHIASGGRLDIGGQNGSIGQLQSAGVPEPSAWALMIFGFGGVGSLLRHRRSLLIA